MATILPAIISFLVIFYPAVTDLAPNHHLEGSVAQAAQSETPVVTNTYKVWVTAYSSTPDQTDDTPFITAHGTEVHDGIIAANFLPFGAKVMIPKLFGDRVFVVEDRMHERKKNFVDIWMPTKEMAVNFGIYYTEIVAVQ